MSGFSTYRAVVVGVAVTVGLFALALPQARSEAADPAADRDLCTRLWTDYIGALKGADLVSIAGFFANDSVLIYPDMPELRGHDAIQAHFVEAFKGVKILDATFTLNQFGVAGDQAFTFVTIDETYQLPPSPQVKTRARVGVVWRRQRDNRWQIQHFLLNHLTP